MQLIIFLILFPFLTAGVLVFTKNNTLRKTVVYISAGAIMLASVAFAIWQATSFGGQVKQFLWDSHVTHAADYIMLAAEIGLTVMIIIMGIKHKKFLAPLLSVAGTGVMTWLELTGRAAIQANHMYSDVLTGLMFLIIGIVGSLICIYAVGYMEDYHHHHTEYKDRRTFFFPMLFVFLGAMFGLVVSFSGRLRVYRPSCLSATHAPRRL